MIKCNWGQWFIWLLAKPRQELKEGICNQELKQNAQRNTIYWLDPSLVFTYLSYIGRPNCLGMALPTEGLTLLPQL